MEISASILNVENDENTTNTFYRLETAGIDYFHIDVMDGEFVKNNTISKMQFFADFISGISTIPLDVHLMVKDVKKYVDMFAPCLPKCISFHIEKSGIFNTECEQNVENDSQKYKLRESKEIMKNINYIKNNNCKVGIAINPETDVENVYNYLPYVHNVMLMSVHPGKGGQKFIEKTTEEKLEKLRHYICKNRLDTEIEIDGGINYDTIKLINKADIAVVGKFLVESKDYKYTVNKLK